MKMKMKIKIASIFLMMLLAWSSVIGQELRFVIFSVNSADATLIIFPTGKTMLVDSGTETMCQSRIIPFLQKHNIDYLDYYAETHPHGDHDGGRASLVSAGIINDTTKVWNEYRKYVNQYYNSTEEGPKELLYESQFDMEGTKWFISNREDIDFFNSTNANINSLAFRMEYNGFIYSHGGDEARLSMDRYLADHPDLVEAHVRNTAHHMRGPVRKNYLEATNAELYVISNMPGMSADKTYYNLLLDTIDELQGNGREHEAIITGDVGHVVIRASGEDDWSYETCLDYGNCVFDYIHGDLCPDDTTKTEPELCGCGVPEGTCATSPLTVYNGSGNGTYYPYEKVNIEADSAPEGEMFDVWEVNAGNPLFANVNSSSTILQMQGTEVSITATYKTIPLVDKAEFVSQEVPDMVPGETVTVSVSMKNNGNTTWTSDGVYKLGSVNDDPIWRSTRVDVSSEVLPDAQETFTFDVTAPTTEGSYNFQWRMIMEDEWFGQPSENQSVLVLDTNKIDHTNPPGTGTITRRAEINATEGALMAFDNSSATKWLDNSGVPSVIGPSWIQIQLPSAQIVDVLTITSANDYPERDPQDFVLKGSNDGSTFITLGSWIDEIWTDRFMERGFSFNNSTAFRYYRLQITKNAGNIKLTQLSEIKLLGFEFNPTIPESPSALNAKTDSALVIDISWTDNANYEDGFKVERKQGSIAYEEIVILDANVTSYSDTGLTLSDTYTYRVRAFNTAGNSDYSNEASTEVISSVHDLINVSAQQQVVIYPNPLNYDVLSIDLLGFENSSDVNIKIVDLLGKTVIKRTVHNTKTLNINTNGLERNALYLVVVSTEQSTITKRLMLQ